MQFHCFLRSVPRVAMALRRGIGMKLTSNLGFYGCQECVDATDELGCRPCETVQCELLGAQKGVGFQQCR